MKTMAELPEIDFKSKEYLSSPLETLAEYAKLFKVGQSERGVEILDYNLCRDTILDRRFGTGHPKLMKVLGMSDGPALNYKKNSTGCCTINRNFIRWSFCINFST